MVCLRVDFRQYTSKEWAKERLLKLGFFGSNDGTLDNQFMLIDIKPETLHAKVMVRDEDELRVSMSLLLISRVTKITRA